MVRYSQTGKSKYVSGYGSFASMGVSAVRFCEDLDHVVIGERNGIEVEENANGSARELCHAGELFGRDAVVAHLEVVDSAGLLQSGERVKEVLWLRRVFLAHKLRHLDELLWACALADQVPVVGERDHD